MPLHNPGGLAYPAWQSGRYYYLPAGGTSAVVTGNGTLRATQFYVPSAVTLTKLGAEVSTVGEAGSKVRLGIYADDGTGRPGVLLLDAGQIAGDSATVQELSVSLALSPGWYWSAAVAQGATTTQPTLRTVTTVAVSTDAGSAIPGVAAGAVAWTHATSIPLVATGLPTPFVLGAAMSATMPRMFGKTA